VDTETAIKTQIEPKLIHVFGLQMANSMLTRATLCYVLADGGEKRRYGVFVHSICSDDRAVQMWGAAEAAEQERVWRDLIRSEPHIDANRR
jgi:hypothetical protein